MLNMHLFKNEAFGINAKLHMFSKAIKIKARLLITKIRLSSFPKY